MKISGPGGSRALGTGGPPAIPLCPGAAQEIKAQSRYVFYHLICYWGFKMLIFWIFVLLLFLVFLAIFALACHIRRARARARADRIIAGKLQVNTIEINRCITILTSTNAWLINGAFRDQHRIEKLREIQNGLLRRQTSIFEKSPLRCR